MLLAKCKDLKTADKKYKAAQVLFDGKQNLELIATGIFKDAKSGEYVFFTNPVTVEKMNSRQIIAKVDGESSKLIVDDAEIRIYTR